MQLKILILQKEENIKRKMISQKARKYQSFWRSENHDILAMDIESSKSGKVIRVQHEASVFCSF